MKKLLIYILSLFIITAGIAYASELNINKSFQDSTTTIVDDGDNTKVIAFQASGITTGTTRTVTIPDADVTILTAADAAAINTGTATTSAATPDALAGSYAGTKSVEMVVFDFATDTATGDGKFYFTVPAALNGMNLVSVAAQVITAGTTGTTNVDLARCVLAATGNACSGVVADMLSTNITIDTGENSSADATAAAVIDTTTDDVATGQIIRVDVDAVHSGVAAKGLEIVAEFRLP